MKCTKAILTDYVKHQLSTSPTWALRGLVKIYERQTISERAIGATSELNGVGFAGTDSVIMSSFAQQYTNRGSLSDKQMAVVFKLIKKYHKQIISLIPAENMPKVEADALAYHQANSQSH